MRVQEVHPNTTAQSGKTGRGEPAITIVIPVLATTTNLPEILPLIPSWVHEVVLVTSTPSQKLRDLSDLLRPETRVIEAGSSPRLTLLRRGYEVASGDIIVTFDPASGVSPAVTGKLVRALRNGSDYAVGSRFLYRNQHTDLPLPKWWGNAALERLVKLLHGGYYSDPASGVFAFWKRVLPLLNIDEGDQRARLLGAHTVINVQALRARLKITEVPIKVGEDGAREGADPVKKRAPKVSVVIPALNEAENLPHVLPRIPEWVHEVLLVDGFSTDDTIEVAKRIRPDIRVVHQVGSGKGAALRSGVDAAKGDIVVMMDADGSTDPSEIGLFVRELRDGADFVKGSRFLQGGGTADMPRYRQLGNWGLVTLANTLFVTHYSDITYGYNATWRRYKDELALDIDDWASEIISNIRAANNGLLVVEVPSFENERIAGTAKLEAFSAGWMILKAILREWANKIGLNRRALGTREEMQVVEEQLVDTKRS
jgi:hypothetical protein